MGAGKWIADALCEDESQPSASRLLSSLVVLISLGLLVAIVVFVLLKKVPFTLSDIAAFMTALAAFDASVIGVLYGVNKISTAVSDIFVGKDKDH